MAFASLILGGIGAASSAFGALEGGLSTGEAASYQAQVAKNNAVIEQQNAKYAIEAGEAQSENESLKSAAQGGAIKVAEAAGNVDVNTGSAAKVQESQREVGELNTLTTMNNAMLKAYGYESEATGFTAQAGLESLEAEEAPIGGALSAGGGLLGSASSLGFRWTGAQNNTVDNPF